MLIWPGMRLLLEGFQEANRAPKCIFDNDLVNFRRSEIDSSDRVGILRVCGEWRMRNLELVNARRAAARCLLYLVLLHQ